MDVDGLEDITSLKISGTLSGSDIENLGYVLRSDSYYIKNLDLSDVVFGSGEYYVEYESELYGHHAYTVSMYRGEITYGMFGGCRHLEEIVLPNDLNEIYTQAFFECWALRKVTMPESVYMIWGQAFAYCKSLTDINIPDSLRYLEISAFYDCESLEEIKIPEKIPYVAMTLCGKCYSLKELRLHAGITSVWDQAFYDCNPFPVYCYATTPPELGVYPVFGHFTFDGTEPGYYFGGDLYVPQGCREAYEESDWNNYFAGRIYEME